MSHHTFTEAIADYFRERPNEWIRAELLEAVGGRQAWRSRVSNARLNYDMQIDNRTRVIRTHGANCPGIAAPDLPEACSCGRPGRYTLSEYRFTPKSEPVQASLLERQGAAA